VDRDCAIKPHIEQVVNSRREKICDVLNISVLLGGTPQKAATQLRQICQITIERNEENLILGKFVPSPDFSAIEHLFEDFEEAVNLQALSVVDELDTKIVALGLYLRTPDGLQRIEIHDVQIWMMVTYLVTELARVQAELSNKF
jgi:hypothetical protein